MWCKYPVLCVVLLFCLNSCKKDSKAPNSGVSIVGKWFITKQSSVLSYNGSQVNAFTKTNFTSSDFVEYYSDGTGYFSQTGTTGPSLTEFTYTLAGTALTQFTSNNNSGTPETITSLTASGLSIHAVSLVTDPNNPDQQDNEVDDYTYTR